MNDFDDDDVEFADKWCEKHSQHYLTRSCFECGGEGGFDGEELMEEDPLWYDEDSYESCSNCRGRGFFTWCPGCAKEEYVAATVSTERADSDSGRG